MKVGVRSKQTQFLVMPRRIPRVMRRIARWQGAVRAQ